MNEYECRYFWEKRNLRVVDIFGEDGLFKIVDDRIVMREPIDPMELYELYTGRTIRN